MDWITITASPFLSWLYDSVAIVVRAVPDFGLSLIMIASGFFMLFMAWHLDWV